MLKAMADNNIEISTREDAAMYDTFAGNDNYIFKGIGDEMGVKCSAASLIAVLGTGGCIIQGRHVYETAASGTLSSISLEPNSQGFLVVRYNLSKPVGSEAEFMAVSTVEKQQLNNDGVICDLILGEYVTNDLGVIDYVDRRNFNSLSSRVSVLESRSKIYSSSIFEEPEGMEDGDILIIYTDAE